MHKIVTFTRMTTIRANLSYRQKCHLHKGIVASTHCVMLASFLAVLGTKCKEEDYKQWSPTDNPRLDCLLGSKMVFERRRAHSLCFNGHDYEREISQVNCSCTIEDYEW